MQARNTLLTVEQVGAGIELPDRDIRKTLDEAARRGWTEQSRRLSRVVVLFAADTVAGMAGVATVINTWWLVSNGGARPRPWAIPLVAMVCCIQPLALRVTGAYGGGRSRVSLGRIAAAIAIAGLVGWIQARLFGAVSPYIPNKTAYVYSAALISLFIYFERIGFDQLVKAGFRAGVLQRRVLIIGHRADVEEVQRKIDHVAASDLRVVSALSPDVIEAVPGRLERALRDSGANGAIIAANLPFRILEQIIGRCFRSGVSVSLLPKGLQGLGSSYIELRQSGAGMLLHVLPIRFGLPQLALKRTMDIVFTVAAVLVIWPLLLIVALLVKLDSKGPVFFRQCRMGVGGKKFQILKFRTMALDAEARKASLQHLNQYPDAKLFKIKDDPRVTRLGRFLRTTSLDELPQLWNVLKGDMSLVGPRPCVPSEFAHYEPHHFVRLAVVPGLTGPWQVNGRNNVLDFEEVVRMEQEYIRSWSLVSDLAILAKTVPTIFRRGAY